jgi:hypothetical protein
MDAPVKGINTEKAKALQAALSQIEKQFGKGTIKPSPPVPWDWMLRWGWAVYPVAA